MIGIDPGFTGAIAFLDYEQNFLQIADMPLTSHRNRKQIDGTALSIMFAPHNPFNTMVIIEDVHSMPNQGVSSTFWFGYNSGIILGVAKALTFRTLKVPPGVWKSALNLSTNKKDSLALAKKVFPDYSDYFKRAKDDGRAEAALLAYFAHKQKSG